MLVALLSTMYSSRFDGLVISEDHLRHLWAALHIAVHCVRCDVDQRHPWCMCMTFNLYSVLILVLRCLIGRAHVLTIASKGFGCGTGRCALTAPLTALSDGDDGACPDCSAPNSLLQKLCLHTLHECHYDYNYHYHMARST